MNSLTDTERHEGQTWVDQRGRKGRDESGDGVHTHTPVYKTDTSKDLLYSTGVSTQILSYFAMEEDLKENGCGCVQCMYNEIALLYAGNEYITT